MAKLTGSILAALLALQAGLPSLGLTQPLSNIVALGVGVAVAGLAFYLKGSPAPAVLPPVLPPTTPAA